MQINPFLFDKVEKKIVQLLKERRGGCRRPELPKPIEEMKHIGAWRCYFNRSRRYVSTSHFEVRCDMYGMIYLLTNTRTKKQYVGQTTQSLDARFNRHVSDALAGEPTPLATAIRLHGVQAFTRQILRTLVRVSDLDTVERNYINRYGTLHPYGYNQRLP